jgi:photosystem II stability/assembly factor-like uncharacterized protein
LIKKVGRILLILLLTGCAGEGLANENTPDHQNPPEQVVIETVPDNFTWRYGQVAVGGGGFVTGIIATSEEGLHYARTDVGGAYRRSSGDDGWVSLGYHISEEYRGLLGVDGIACDPNEPGKLYLLCGTEYFSGGKTALLISHDYGATFTQVDLTGQIRVHGNGMGRGNGERIAVDPHSGNIIFVGGRTGGLLKSTDGGYTFDKVTGFPVDRTNNKVGINIIVFDPATEKDGITQRIYAGVSEKDSDEGNLFVSEDGGESWNRLEDAVNDLMPQRIKLDSKGYVYVTYADYEGPWNIRGNGAVYKYAPGGGSPMMIAPQSQPFGDIAIHPEDDNKLVLVTTNTWQQQPNDSWGDVFYTSTDGGETWRNLRTEMKMGVGKNPWIEGASIHWCSSLMMDSFNGDRVMVNSGNGIFTCDNIWDDAPLFYFDSYGLEEIVPLDIITMEGYPLISAAGDVDGFRHDDIFTPAMRHQDKIGSTSSITIAAKNRDYWVKISEGEQKITYTTDGGKTWTLMKNYPESADKPLGGRAALNADGSVLVWSPRNGRQAYYTADFGETWHKTEGLTADDAYVLGDPNDKDYFFASSKSTAYVSADGGKTFTPISGVLPMQKRFAIIPMEAGAFYIPSFEGLSKVTDYGQNTELVPNVKFCEAVGIGRGKHDDSPPVIYIWGTVADSDILGIYMSEDGGGNWRRVNDDLHHFGGPGNGVFISGDLNVYGRCYMSTVGLGIVYCDLVN